MFSLPQPPRHTSEDTESLDVVDVSDTANVLDTFLQLIYPVDPPAIEDLRLLDDLFRLADKYIAKSVTAKLRKLLVLPSFLKDDPIWVYAIAYHANFKEEAELAITHTFKIDLVGGIPRTHLQMMTAEMYNSLLVSHAARRAGLVSALFQAKAPPAVNGCSCGSLFYPKLHKNIVLAIWESPFLDRQRLNSCFSNPAIAVKSTCGLASSCRVSRKMVYMHFASILEEVGKLG